MNYTAPTALALMVVAMSGLGLPGVATAQDRGYQAATEGTRVLEGLNGFSIKMLVEQSNLGGSEVEIGEITFPVGAGQGTEWCTGSYPTVRSRPW